jgi:ABC-type glycerol-3-phosphate transport system substrate-binding protein
LAINITNDYKFLTLTNMKNSFKLAILTLVIAVSATACGGNKSDKGGDTTTTVTDTTTVTNTVTDSTKKDTVVVDTTKKDTTKK